MRIMSLVLIGIATGASASDRPVYVADDLSARLPSSSDSIAVDIADNGVVTGSLVDDSGRRKPFVAGTQGDVRVFDAGYYDDRLVRAGNARGKIIGSFPGSTLGWVRVGDDLRCIPSPFDCESIQSIYTSSLPYDLNDDGIIVGSVTITENGQPYTYQGYKAVVGPDGVIEVSGLGRYQQRDTTASAIDPNAVIVGFAVLDRTNATYQPVFLDQGVWQPLGEPGRYQAPIALNQQGVIVGSRRTDGDFREQPLRWSLASPEQAAETLPTLPDRVNARPNGINAAGEIVGVSYDSNHPADRRAWMLIGDDLVALDDLLEYNDGWQILAANAINSQGDIAATARRAGESGTRAVVLRRQSSNGLFQHGFDLN